MIRSLKRFSVIATLCLAFVLIMICVMHVKASTSDVKGIDSGIGVLYSRGDTFATLK